MAELFIIAASVIAAIYFTRMAIVDYLEFNESLDKPYREMEEALRKAKEGRDLG